jgi:serine/threonine protein kinase/Tol biopolymer transport system component
VAEENLVGKRLGQYEIQSLIGKGGMSTVYRAYQPSVNRTVAIKTLPPEFLHDGTFLVRFEREARLIAQLEHFHILPVYDAGQAEGIPYIVMRYLPGGSLADLMQRYGRFSAQEAVPIIQQIAAALDYAHQRGVIHRDVKPSNILLDEEGNAYLSDFGIARVREATAAMTGSGLVGTPAYLAPEVGRGDRVIGPSVDIYALGVTLFQMLTGKVPFRAETPIKQIMMHVTEPVPAPSSLNPEITPAVEAVVLRALAKEPAQRFKTAEAMARALAEAAQVSTDAVHRTDITDLLEAGKGKRSAPALPPAVKEAGGGQGIPPVTPPPPASTPTPPSPVPQQPAVAPSRREQARQQKAVARDMRRRERARAPQAQRGVRWYTVALTLLALIIVWFALGTLAGFTVRREVNRVLMISANATQTQSAALTATVSAATQSAYVIASQQTVAAITEAAPTDTPTPTETPAPTFTPSPTPLGGAQGVIAFVSERDGEPEIFLLDLLSGTQTPITNNTSSDETPTWSADGRFVAYSGQSPRGRHIFVYDTTLGTPIELTQGTRVDADPAWSPDGKAIALYSSEAGRAFIRVHTFEGDEYMVVQLPPGPIRLLDWSPDGQIMTIFGYTPLGDLEVMHLNVETGERTAITRAFGDINFVSYSPDRTRVLYTATANGYRQVFMSDTNCGLINVITQCNVRRLTNDRFNYYTPRFSPDGTLVLVASNLSGNLDLWLLDLEGNAVQRLTSSPFDEYDGVWQPAVGGQ